MQLNGPIVGDTASTIINNGSLSHSSVGATVLSIKIANSGNFSNTGSLTINGLFTCDHGSITTAASSVFVSFMYITLEMGLTRARHSLDNHSI
jgi:hypothetical protein